MEGWAGTMARVVRCSLIQAKNEMPPGQNGGGPSLADIKQAMITKHTGMIRTAAADGAQIICLQEIFYGPYFCAEQTTRWYESTERVPDGPTVQLMCSLAHELGVALVVPVYEVEEEGVFYNTAAVIGRDGKYLGK